MRHALLFLALFLLLFLSCKESYLQDKSMNSTRERMVEEQLRKRDITDPRVLDAMRKVPRHHFVPPSLSESAYEDRALPIGEEQTISQPYVVAYMTQALGLKGDEKVLEIGTGSGYQAAVLSLLCKRVYTIEIRKSLADRAKTLLHQEGYSNVFVKTGDGYLGWKEHAPYQAIIVTAAPPEIPEKLVEQLADGGRMVVPLGGTYPQTLVLLEKQKGKITRKELMPVLFVPMIKGKEGEPPTPPDDR